MARQRNNRPTNKVIAGSIGAAVATIGIYVIEQLTGAPLPPSVQTAIIAVTTFALGYLVPPSAHDTLDVERAGEAT